MCGWAGLNGGTAAAETVKPSAIRPAYRPAAELWDLRRLAQAPRTYPAERFATNGLQALFFDGPDYHGKPTRVFAYLGIPRHAPGRNIPGIVLVHGGGGTAFADWVKLWNDRGYAAIAMDTCGGTPEGEFNRHPRHAWSGPPGWGGFDQIGEPRQDQWAYHAVASVILAHSLLRAQDGVDPDRIGITGISWGGYLTCLVVGVDSRFQFAAPVYGCGHYRETIFDANLKAMGEANASQWTAWWDPERYLPKARIPMLWVSGSNDLAYSMDALQATYRAPAGRQTLCVRLRMPHAHGGPGESPKEIHVFAESVVNHGDPLARIRAQGRDGDAVWAKFQSARPIVKAELNYTADTGDWKKRLWATLPARLARGRATATLPPNAKFYYLNLTDDRGCVVSAPHVACP